MSLLIFFVYPNPKGSEENQFTPHGDGVNKLIFKRLAVGCINFTVAIWSISYQKYKILEE